MADEATHRAEAVGSRRVAEYLLTTQASDPTALRWAVTATFYGALHALSAHLIARGVTVANHDDRSVALADLQNQVPSEVFQAYQFLKRRATGARYHVQTFAPWQVQRLLDVPIQVIFDFVGL